LKRILKAILLYAMSAVAWFIAWMFLLLLVLMSRGYLFAGVLMAAMLVFGLFLVVESDYMPELSQAVKAGLFVLAYLTVFIPLGFGLILMLPY